MIQFLCMSFVPAIFNRKKRIVISVFVIVAIILIGRQVIYSEENKTTDHATVKRSDIKTELTLSGKVDAEEHAFLQFQTSGLLTWVGVKEGDTVEKNQRIASLDVRDVKKKLQKNLNNYLTSRASFDQTHDDQKDRPETDALKRIAAKIQYDMNNTIIDVELQDLALQLANITSPINGLVVHVDSPLPGVNITPAGARFEIINPSTINFLVLADQTEITKLHEGEHTYIVLDSYPDERIDGTIDSLAYIPKTGESGTVYEVKVSIGDLDPAAKKFRIGMTGDARFTEEDKRNVLVLPTKFIKNDAKGSYVLKGPKKEKKYIKIGIDDGTRTEITDGTLKEGDVVYD